MKSDQTAMTVALAVGLAFASLTGFSSPAVAIKLVECSDYDAECLTGCFGVLKPYSEDYLLIDDEVHRHGAAAVFLPMNGGGSSITGSTGYGECEGADLEGRPWPLATPCVAGDPACEPPVDELVPLNCDLADEMPELTAIAEQLTEGENPPMDLLNRAIELVSSCVPG